MCLPVLQVGVWGRAAGGAEGAFLVALPAPASPWHMLDLPAPENHFLRAGTCLWHWYACLQQRVRSGGFPPCLTMPAGGTGAPVPTHQRNPLPGHKRSTGSHYVSSIPQESFISDHAAYRVP